MNGRLASRYMREFIRTDTGRDPVREASFAWSNRLPCDECGIHDSTAEVIVLDDGGPTRLCAHCYMDVTR